MRELKHQRIIANAGSGKTYRLTTRYIELLAREVPPERIIALTFTRKAAGEFLDAIFRRLLSAATEPDQAARLARDIGQPQLVEADFLRFLNQLIGKLPQLALGTLDGFFGRIIRVFPFECGLAGDITILDPHFQDVTRRTVLGQVFRAHAASEKSFRELLELLRQQSRNRQSRSVVATLDAEVRSLHEKYLLTPPGREWGDVDAIWPDGMAFPASGRLSSLVDEFESELFVLHPDMADKHRSGWEERIEMLRRLRPGYDVPEKAATFALRAIDPARSKLPDCFELKLVNKPFAFPDRLLFLVNSLGRAILGIDLYSRIERSAALYHLLQKFEDAYQRNVRAAGRLTFHDITGLLAGGHASGGQSLGTSVRQAIDYRLDATYDHWLLDEFQDTSRLQWTAVRDLIDEVVQSDSGQRSFFYVGDTKQAIYSWRGGDPRLFEEIAKYYNASSEERIDTSESLATSYRSKPEVLDVVNYLFDPDHLRSLSHDMDFPPEVIEHWRAAWRAHQPSDPVTGQAVVRWQTFTGEDGLGAGDLLDLETARLLEEIQPGERGWTCAVLVHANKRIASIVNQLRAHGLPAAAEGRTFPCTDNELASALLALLRAVAHPSDTLALAHVGMSPLAHLLGDDTDQFRLQALKDIHAHGLAETVRLWLTTIDLEPTPFLRHRAETFLQAAAEFDDTTDRSATIDDFIDFAREYSVTESGATGVIRVMTMHASKGLDFDIVVLPEIQGVSLPSRRDDSSIHLHTGQRGQVQWGLELPPKAICAVDPILGRAYEEDVVEDCYEKFCLYYVALTRAKRGLYLLSTRQPEDSKSHDFNRLLHLTYPEGHATIGNLDWFHQAKAPELVEAAPELPSITVAPSIKDSAPTALHPSSTGQQFARRFPASVLLEPTNLLGNEIHRTLARIEWWDGGSLAAPAVPISDVAQTLIDTFLASPAAQSLFQAPAEPARVWREKSFDLLINGQRISGVFDRVVIHDDHATLFDYKTDEDPAEIVERHGDQLRLYRTCLATLLAWPEERITAHLVSIRTAEVLNIDSAVTAPLAVSLVEPPPVKKTGSKASPVATEQPDLFGFDE